MANGEIERDTRGEADRETWDAFVPSYHREFSNGNHFNFLQLTTITAANPNT